MNVMSPDIGASIAIASPDAARAEWLLQSLNSRLVDSLSYLVQVAGDSLGHNVGAIRNLLSNTKKERLSPLFYIHHANLLAAMEEQSVDEVGRVLAELHTFPSSEQHRNRIRVHVSASPSWIADCVRLIRHRNIADMVLRPVAHEAELYDCTINHVLNELLAECPDMQSEIRTYVSDVIVLDTERITGASGIDLFGAIFFAAPSAHVDHIREFFLEKIVHEAAHLHVFCLLAQDPILLNGQGELVFSPLRNEPRPLMGIFHGLFVIARVLHAFEKLQSALDAGWVAKELLRQGKQFKECQAILAERGQFTPMGQELFKDTVSLAFGAGLR
jgi:hypothetical protein